MKRRLAKSPPNRMRPNPSLRNRMPQNPMLRSPTPLTPGRQQKSAGKTGAFDLVYFIERRTDATGYCNIGPLRPPPCSAICELNGESPCFGSSTTTMAPIFTRLYRSITSSLVMRMQPEEIEAPIYSGWLVPWIRNRVSLPPEYRYSAREPIGLSGPGATNFGTPRREISPGVGCQAGHSVMLPILAMPDHAIASSPTVMP